MPQDIETKEIRGVNLKWLSTLVVIVATGTSSYYGIKSKIETDSLSNQSKFEMLQYQIKGLVDRITYLEKEVDETKKQVDQNKGDVRFYHKRN